jgi:membrane protein YqaA with SNARE-associated domain
MTVLAAFGGLFLAALIAGSILPLQSEAVLATLLLTTDHSPILLVLVASAGNTLGAVINWLLGRGIERFRDRRWFPASPATLQRAQAHYQRYGKWTLLLSWVPVIGDPLTVIAGVMREPLGMFILLVAIAKTARYVVVAALALGLA